LACWDGASGAAEGGWKAGVGAGVPPRVDLANEQVYSLRPLSLPTTEPETLGDLEGSDAVELFVARAGTHDTAFALDDSLARLVASICWRPDGVPYRLRRSGHKGSPDQGLVMALADGNRREALISAKSKLLQTEFGEARHMVGKPGLIPCNPDATQHPAKRLSYASTALDEAEAEGVAGGPRRRRNRQAPNHPTTPLEPNGSDPGCA